jgi:predicted nucleic acid-binding Zn ribbon protein
MAYSISGGPKDSKNILGDLIKSQGWGDKLKELELPELWKEIVGDVIAERAKYKKFSDGIIYIATASSTWRTELQLRSEDIIKQLNQKLGNEKVKEIKFK